MKKQLLDLLGLTTTRRLDHVRELLRKVAAQRKHYIARCNVLSNLLDDTEDALEDAQREVSLLRKYRVRYDEATTALDAAQVALDEGQGKGSKSDAGSIFDEANNTKEHQA